MKQKRTVRAFVGKRINSERSARKKILKQLGVSNKRFKRMNKAARRSDEGYHFVYDQEKKIYIGKKSE